MENTKKYRKESEAVEVISVLQDGNEHNICDEVISVALSEELYKIKSHGLWTNPNNVNDYVEIYSLYTDISQDKPDCRCVVNNGLVFWDCNDDYNEELERCGITDQDLK